MAYPEVIAFYHDHGVDTGFDSNDFESSKRFLELQRSHEQEFISTDPLRVLVTVRYEGDELQMTLDEEMRVLEASRDDPAT